MAERMPFRENAVIDPRKFFEYLLDTNSPRPHARAKAALWKGVGYTKENAGVLMELILSKIQTAEIAEEPSDEGYGLKYRFWIHIPHLKRGEETRIFASFIRDRLNLDDPNEGYSEQPRLVTAFPD